MAANGISVVDGDGHVMEDWDALLQYMPEPYIKSGRFRGRIFPPLDHLHSASLFQLVPGAFRQVGVERRDRVGELGQERLVGAELIGVRVEAVERCVEDPGAKARLDDLRDQ